MSNQTVSINGVLYDAQTGLPVDKAETQPTTSAPAFSPRKQVRPSHSIHKTTAKSQTLNRRTVKNTNPIAQPATTTSPHAITKFAAHPSGAKRATKMMDFAPAKRTNMPASRQMAAKNVSPVIAPVTTQKVTPTVSMSPVEPATQKIEKVAPKQQAVVAPAPALKPSHVIKQEAIDQALAAPASTETKRQAAKRQKLAKKQKKGGRIMSIASASLALLLLAGYFTYLNMPSLSVRVAAAQAGVDASYPAYKPDGYSVNGLVTYSPGTVSMKFAANGSSRSYTIDQTKKNWDSSAALENYVKPKSGGSYIPYSEHGLTIYTFNSNAAWVNNGILYTISGDAPLSSDQIRQIAVSM